MLLRVDVVESGQCRLWTLTLFVVKMAKTVIVVVVVVAANCYKLLYSVVSCNQLFSVKSFYCCRICHCC